MKKSTAPRILVATGKEINDVRYATGLTAPDPFGLLVESSGDMHLVVSSLEAARAQKVCPRATLHTPSSLLGFQASRRGLAAQLLALTRNLRIKRVRVGPYFPHGIAHELQKGGVNVQLDSTPPFPERAIKTPREITAIRRSQRAAVAAMRGVRDTLRRANISPDGLLKIGQQTLTSEMLKAQITRVLLEHRCNAEGTIVACGAQAARPHDEGHGPLRAGATIVVDIFPRSLDTGYWGDITRTFVRGPVPPQIHAMYRAVLAAQKLALSLLRPGAECRALQQAVERLFQLRGFPTRFSPPGKESGFIHSLGHGVGLDIHESPRLRNEPGRLAVGHVVTVEPGLYLPGIGGIRIEDTVVITPTGHKILATFPKKLEA